MRSYSPISLLHWALFVWSRVAVYMCVFSFFFFCVCTTAADQPRQRRGISGDTHLCAVWERNKGRRGRRGQRGGRRDRQAGGKKKRQKQGGKGEREALPISPWSAAKCTDPSDGNTQSVHLFEPAGHRYLSQWRLHPQTHPRARRGGGTVGGGGVQLFSECRRGSEHDGRAAGGVLFRGGVKFTSNAGIHWNSLLHRVCFM